MKFFLTLVLAFLIPFFHSAAEACKCSSGCPTGYVASRDDGHLTTKMVSYVNNISKSFKILPISCYRARECQKRLYDCYNACGQKGRAAPPGRSYHEKGRACDFSPAQIVQSSLRAKAPLVFGSNYNLIKHKARHGGGHHIEDHSSGGSKGAGAADTGGGADPGGGGGVEKPKTNRIRDYINGICRRDPCTDKFWCSPIQRSRCTRK